MAINGGFDLEWRLVAGKDCGNSAGDFLNQTKSDYYHGGKSKRRIQRVLAG